MRRLKIVLWLLMAAGCGRNSSLVAGPFDVTVVDDRGESWSMVVPGVRQTHYAAEGCKASIWVAAIGDAAESESSYPLGFLAVVQQGASEDAETVFPDGKTVIQTPPRVLQGGKVGEVSMDSQSLVFTVRDGCTRELVTTEEFDECVPQGAPIEVQVHGPLAAYGMLEADGYAGDTADGASGDSVCGPNPATSPY